MDPERTLNGPCIEAAKAYLQRNQVCNGSNHNGKLGRTKVIYSLEDKKTCDYQIALPNSYPQTIRDGRVEETGVVSATEGEYQAHNRTNKQRKQTMQYSKTSPGRGVWGGNRGVLT